MAENIEFSIVGHPSIYAEKACKERKLNIYLGVPEKGVNLETGLVLFIPGFGGNAKSNVYKKMRDHIADKYNLVTIQCDYFGYEFMQASTNAVFHMDNNALKELLGSDSITDSDLASLDLNYLIVKANKANGRSFRITGKEKLDETVHNFNDMGIMQAIDNVSAVLATIFILEDNKYDFNKGKIILYGHSHGAYLTYLCNFMAPELFSLIIDNSGWLYPAYLQGPRYLLNRIGNMEIVIHFNYLASKMTWDQGFLFLQVLYKHFKNKCHIISFHGSADTLVDIFDKRDFCKDLNNCVFNEVNPQKVDGIVFKSTNHGLNADYIKLFDHVQQDPGLNFPEKEKVETPQVIYKTNRWAYNIDYSAGLPIISRKDVVWQG